MLITDLMQARDYLPVQREAARILNTVLGMLNVRPMPDGTVRFGFRADVAFLDRLAMWGASAEDIEGLHDDDEDGGDREPDVLAAGRSGDDPAEVAAVSGPSGGALAPLAA